MAETGKTLSRQSVMWRASAPAEWDHFHRRIAEFAKYLA
jgi:hypothetical protein